MTECNIFLMSNKDSYTFEEEENRLREKDQIEEIEKELSLDKKEE